MTRAPHQITGSAVLDAHCFFGARLRQDGQWFQLGPDAQWASEGPTESAGLHYNWHRHYDVPVGRYTQPDPLGFVDGPGVYGYAGGSPQQYVDRDGRFSAGEGATKGAQLGRKLCGPVCAVAGSIAGAIVGYCVDDLFQYPIFQYSGQPPFFETTSPQSAIRVVCS
jgi:RHS repeat-associated protein